MKLFKWQKGRQGSGYLKMPLILSKWPIPFDWYLIKFPDGSYIDKHTDSTNVGEHWRLNIELWKPRAGGHFVYHITEGAFCKRFWRFTLFRPDITPHAVSRVEGTRLVLSIGWIRPV